MPKCPRCDEQLIDDADGCRDPDCPMQGDVWDNDEPDAPDSNDEEVLQCYGRQLMTYLAGDDGDPHFIPVMS